MVYTFIKTKGLILNKGVKMNKKISLLIVGILTSLFSVLNISGSNATDCNANNPCGVWAMLDSQGTVTNVIVCQPSVCGGGTLFGTRVVPQLPANPVTHDPTGVGSFIGTPENPITYTNDRFNVNIETTVVRTDVETTPSSETISTVVIPVKLDSFSYQEIVDLQKPSSEIPAAIGKFNESKPTIISVVQTSENEKNSESVQIFERSTASELQSKMQSENLNIMLGKFQTIISLLGSWVK
jgi:hypothetical protein